ncbi:MAG: 4-phosphopantoate--beta-alanine ligase [Methanohalophilus sp.]
MTGIPRTHPRYNSLIARENIVEGVNKGITSIQGLVAQGRGECFDYLLGEKTVPSALLAEKIASALFLLADRPVISVNGNTSALVPEKMVELASVTGASLEVNLFHRTEERVSRIIAHLESFGATCVLGAQGDGRLDLEHARAIVDQEGIYSADVVLVPLEDGDRCQKLVEMGKTVIAIDLNPFSRTSKTATLTIVDNVSRAMENLINYSREFGKCSHEELEEIAGDFDNATFLREAVGELMENLENQ